MQNDSFHTHLRPFYILSHPKLIRTAVASKEKEVETNETFENKKKEKKKEPFRVLQVTRIKVGADK